MPTIVDVETASLCAGTPGVLVRDNRGLVVRTLQYNRSEADQPVDQCVTSHRFTAAGHLSSSIDPRLFSARQLGDTVLPNFRYVSSLSGRPLGTLSQDAGPQIVIHDVEGAPIWKKNGRCHIQRWTCDALHRPVEVREQDERGTARVSERFLYGEAEAEPAVDNSRGQLVRHYDTAGLIEMPSFSTSGKALRSVRRLLADPVALSDWTSDEPRCHTALETVAYENRSSYNALGVVERSTDAMGNAQQQIHDVAGRLAGSSATLKGGSSETILRAITYSAAGKVLSEIAGNGVVTDCAYEAQTQRLNTLRTTRPSQTGLPALLQDLSYTYDPVGNALSVSDAAVPTRFHDNQRVDATNAYTYDALYQLQSATGRESANAGQQTQSLPIPIPMDGDASLLSNYTRRFTYDRGGNLCRIQHHGQTSYTSEMLVSPTSNHAVPQTGSLSVSKVEDHFDACGNPKQLMPGQPLSWNERNQLLRVTQARRSGTDDDCETYQYDGGGIRIRKSATRMTGATIRSAEVLYLPGIEIRRTRSNAATVEELHVITLAAAGRQAVRVLHWVTGGPDDIPNDQCRFHLDDQLGSSLMELDRNADILTLEAYYPYGGTAILSGRNGSESKYKFVRYSGKEHDATGLYYYGFRYYAPWLGRWLNPDPGGSFDGINLYQMVGGSPVTFTDLTGLVKIRAGFLPRLRIPPPSHLSGLPQPPPRISGPRAQGNLTPYLRTASPRQSGRVRLPMPQQPARAIGPSAQRSFAHGVQAVRMGYPIASIRLLPPPPLLGAGTRPVAQQRGWRSAPIVGGPAYHSHPLASARGRGSVRANLSAPASASRPSGQFVAQAIANGHAFSKHVVQSNEFASLGIFTRNQFEDHIMNVVDKSTDWRQLGNGRFVFWDGGSGTIVVSNPFASDGGTAFRPSGGRAYFDGLR